MEQTAKPVTQPRRWPQRTAIALGALAIVGWLGFVIAQTRSDGPLTDIIPGGALRSGELVSRPVADWAFAHGETIELQLEEPTKSRWVGALTYQGELYIPCDLGYMWGRMDGQIRRVLHLIYRFKRWHNDALANSNAVLRINGKRYPIDAVLVDDPQLIAELKAELEELAREWMAPDKLGPPPTEGPRDIWFFRVQQSPELATQNLTRRNSYGAL